MKSWSSGNSFLRHLNDDSNSDRVLSMDTQSLAELLSALEAIQIYVKRMSSGKGRIEILPTKINLSIDVSKEMST